MNTNCHGCKTRLTDNDYILCKMNCDHVLCQACFEPKILNNTFRCSTCGLFTENVISKMGNNLIITTQLPKIGTCEIDKHYDEWMDIWKELTKKSTKKAKK